MSFSLRQIQAFCAIVENKNTTHAAEKLNISQPAVSKLISNLEYEVGFLLFKRVNGRLQITPEGRQFYTFSKEYLRSSVVLQDMSNKIKTNLAGRINVAVKPGYSNLLMPQLLADFVKDRPDVFVSIQTHSTKSIVQSVKDGKFDIALCELPKDPTHLNIEQFHYNMVCTLPLDHPLTKKSVLTPKDLKNERLVTLNHDHHTTIHIIKAFQDANVKPNIIAQSLLFRPAAIMATGMGAISFIDSVTARTLYKDESFEIRPFIPIVKQSVAIISNSRYPMSRITQKFNKIISNKMKSLLE